MTFSFDTLEYAEKLIDAGVDEKHAKAQAHALRDAISENVATKHDLEMLEKNLIIKIGAMLVGVVGILAILIKVL
ncbi:MAG: hypothetical protein L3J67_11570 [Hyphomicrobiaceae bacterium]|nr:hypothetical protein [Hyphomicrobiaceae bacterium]